MTRAGIFKGVGMHSGAGAHANNPFLENRIAIFFTNLRAALSQFTKFVPKVNTGDFKKIYRYLTSPKLFSLVCRFGSVLRVIMFRRLCLQVMVEFGSKGMRI